MSNPDQDPVKRSGATSRGVREGVGDGVVAAPSADGDRGRLMLDRFMPYRLAALAETVSEALGDIYRERFDLSRQQWRVLATLAETTDLPTKFRKIVVTDDGGRYVLPDLPKAGYNVFVRGYGLVDSPRVNATLGKALNLTAVIAPNDHAAAQYYPAGYWLSMMRVPEAGEFPGTGPQGNGINPNVRHQAQWLRSIKSGGCTACHVKIFKNGRNQAVRIPREFELPGEDALMRKEGGRLIIVEGA